MSRRTLMSLLVPAGLVPASLLLLALVVPAAVRAGGGCHAPDGSVHMEGSTTVVRMDVCSFGPTVAKVPVGTTVRFLNTSSIDHAVVGRAASWGRAELLQPGKEFSETFTTAGTYPFSCPLHPGMVGAIVVGGGSADNAAPAAVAAGAAPSPEPRAATAVTTAARTDWTPIAIVALGGLGTGAVAGTLVAGVLLNRRRSSSIATD